MSKKRLGQNFLFDPNILNRIMQAAKLSTEDTVVEIGPGLGTLTRMLAASVREVIAVEIDRELCDRLAGELSGISNIELMHGDALEYPYENLKEFKVVANIPYYITTPIIFKLLEHREHLKSITITVQKEIAERIVSGPGGKEYGRLSIMVQYYGKPELKFIIPKGSFRPVPKVDSAVIHIDISEKPVVKVIDESLFFRVIKTAFSQRRKTLANSLKTLLITKSPCPAFTKGGQTGIKEILVLAEIDPVRRPETLSLEEFARLSDVIKKAGTD